MKKFMALLSVLFVFNAYALESPHALEITHEMGTASFETTPKKVVALDWVLSETVLSLGVELEGIADAKGYQQWVVKPELNQGVTDVGSRREPNLELLTKLKPDVILISEHMAAAYHQLNKIAPVLVYSVYSQKKQPIESATAITLSLGKLFDQEQRAQQIIAGTKQRLHDNGEKIQAAGNSDKPLIFARFINDKTLRIHSQGSLAQATIQVMGLKNDWQEPTNLWGFSTTGVVRLAEHQQTNVMLFGPLTENEKINLLNLHFGRLWNSLEQIQCMSFRASGPSEVLSLRKDLVTT